MWGTAQERVQEFCHSACGNAGGNAQVTLGVGDTTIAVPAGHDMVMICPRWPNPGETSPTLILKGAGGDTGIEINAIYPTILCLKDEGDDVIINASAAWSAEVIFGKTATA